MSTAIEPAAPCAILFDLDGTLTDPMEGITRCIMYALEQLGKPVPSQQELYAYIGPPLQKTFATLLDSEEEASIWQAIGLYRERFGSVGKFENTLYLEMPTVLATLQRNGYRLFVATSKPTVYAAEIVAHFGLNSYFERVYGSELTGERTDKTELIAYLLVQEELEASRCVMIGDRRHDMEGACNNGVPGIGILWGYGNAEELAAAGASVLCEKPMDLLQLDCFHSHLAS